MKYILLGDLYQIFIRRRKIIFLYLLCIVFTSFFAKFILNHETNIILTSSLGLNLKFDNNILYLITYVIIKIFPIYLMFYLFIIDIKKGIDNIFLRISKNKWSIFKIISVSIITFIVKFLSYIIVFIINDAVIDSFIKIFILDILLTMLIQLIGIIIYLIFYTYKIISIIVMIILVLLLMYNFSLMMVMFYINKFIMLVISALILVMIYYIIAINMLINVFERSE